MLNSLHQRILLKLVIAEGFFNLGTESLVLNHAAVFGRAKAGLKSKKKSNIVLN
jgi:hypothetical protein